MASLNKRVHFLLPEQSSNNPLSSMARPFTSVSASNDRSHAASFASPSSILQKPAAIIDKGKFSDAISLKEVELAGPLEFVSEIVRDTISGIVYHVYVKHYFV